MRLTDKSYLQVEEYVALVKRGMPDFIEIKGVTFCGDSKASDLTMEHVPYHEEVLKFAQVRLSYYVCFVEGGI